MVETALTLLQRQGYAETSWRTLAQEGGTPLGSIQHFFPEGKVQLATEALELFFERFREFFEGICSQEPQASGRVLAWFAQAADEFEAQGCSLGCPMAAVALDTVPREPSLAHLCAHTLDRWSAYLGSRLPGVGDAQTWVTRVLVAFEGALVLARVQGSGEPLRATGRWLAEGLKAEEA
jgi:TetR/AcrR family transcriptional repressor of lmrAB and yxaGH operons